MHSRAAAPKEVEQSGDLLNGSFHSSSGNHGGAAEKYYSYMLLKEKLLNRNNAAVPDILKATSEKEDIEYMILAKLVKITESSPEFAQIQSLTGTADRFEQSRILAEAVYDKLRAEQILGFYTPEKDLLLNNFYTKTSRSAVERNQHVAAGVAQNVTDGIATRVARALGIAPPAGA